MIKNFTEKILKYTMIFLGLIIFYILFLVVGHAIPRSLVIDNVQKSYKTMDTLGSYFQIVNGASWDNFTDSFFINTAVTEYDGNLVEKALANAYTTDCDSKGYQSMIDGIKCAINGNENIEINSYSRYWIGMMTIYKILLIFMPLLGIKSFVFALTIILFTITVLNVYKELNINGIISFLTSVILALYIPLSMCLVFSTDIIIMLTMMNICYIMLKRNASTDSFCVAFFIAGSILSYLNYWGFPLITLGFPLVFIVTVRLKNQYNTKFLIKDTFLMSLSWGIGLSGTILAKQVLCKIVLGAQTGTSQLLLRLGSELSITDRFISAFNGLFNQMASTPILLITIILIIWTILMFQTNYFKRKYKCYLLLFIALYPLGWWFILANHCIHGFVKHMYGVTYYALLSAFFINCENYAPQRKKFRNTTPKLVGLNIAIVVIWLILSFTFFNITVHYGTKESEPWSTETIDTVNLREKSVIQEVHFDELALGKAYLKNVSTILVNIPDDKKEGALHVEISENDNLLRMTDVSIKDIEIGEYFKIPLGCIIYSGNKYEITYSLKDVDNIEPYLLLQDDSQAARENGVVYISGTDRSGAIINKYEYDDYILSTKVKISILFIILLILQYILFIYKEKNNTDPSQFQ